MLSNHDVIRHASRYGFDPDHRFGEGLSREEVPDAQLGLRRARAATLLMLSLPGAAYLYQGEELGLLEDLRLFDVYTGEQVPEGKKSLAYALRLRADHTLSAEETAGLRKKIVKQTKKKLGAELRS